MNKVLYGLALLKHGRDQMDATEFISAMHRIQLQEADSILPAAAVMRLEEIAELVWAENRFVPGDLVTPREGMNLSTAGKPHIVLGIKEEGYPSGSGISGESGLADIHNIWAACISKGGIVTFTYAHWQLKPYEADE